MDWHQCLTSLVSVGISALGLLPGTAIADDEPAKPSAPPRTIRLLTIGNSFANNSIAELKGLAEAAGHRVIVGAANPGGCSLERHWKAAEVFDANPDKSPAAEALFDEGKIYKRAVMVDGRKTDKREYCGLRDMLTSEPWDYITLQQYSMSSVDETTFEPYASMLHKYIQKLAPTAEVLILQTWAYRQDSGLMNKKLNMTQAEMYDALTGNYRRLGEKLDCRVLPVGAAFQRVCKMEQRPPIATAGYDQDWQMALHSSDTRHASRFGQYLAGAVLYEFLFQESVVGNSYIPTHGFPAAGIAKPDLLFMQGIADETVANPW